MGNGKAYPLREYLSLCGAVDNESSQVLRILANQSLQLLSNYDRTRAPKKKANAIKNRTHRKKGYEPRHSNGRFLHFLLQGADKEASLFDKVLCELPKAGAEEDNRGSGVMILPLR